MITPLYHLMDTPENNQIYIKRDDLYPYFLGGNKARIAKEYLEDMLKKGCTCMVGYGNARSNLVRALVLACKEAGYPCHIISPADDTGERITTFNSRIAIKAGAVIHYCNKENVADTVETVLSELCFQGLRPYYIFGNKYGKGNEAVPTRAYVAVYNEIIKQANQRNTVFDFIFLPIGVGMTQAGLLLGQTFHHGNEEIIGISIARNRTVASTVIAAYCNSYSEMYGTPTVPPKAVNVDDHYIGEGYGRSSYEQKRFIDEMLISCALPLDETYTGKAFWGMAHYLKENKINNKKVLFIHTGGTPLFYDHLMEY